jgi:hypothetical protein
LVKKCDPQLALGTDAQRYGVLFCLSEAQIGFNYAARGERTRLSSGWKKAYAEKSVLYRNL